LKAIPFKFSIFNFPSHTPLLQGEGAKGKAGFTLLEIVIALAIIGGVLVVILHTVNYHAQVSYEDTILTTLTLLAEEKMVEIKKDLVPKEGTFADENISYETTVKNIEDERVVKLTAIVKGYGKEVMLSELVAKKEK